jgi:hypothetical protein
MRKADLAKIHDEFEEDMDWYIDFLIRMLRAKRVVQYYDKLEILESLVIRLCAIWEVFVGDEMIACLNIDSSKCKEELQLRLPKHLSKDLCEAILVGHGYMDFKSVGDIKSFARKVLPDDVNPFNFIRTNPTAKRIDELYIMRNYLSHYSSKSRRTLHKMYQDSWDLKKFREPGDFLLAYSGKRLVQYIGAFLDASEQMRRIIG